MSADAHLVKRLNGCARCHGDGHDDLMFLPLTHPVECDNEPPFTHWVPCPTNDEPILMRFSTAPDASSGGSPRECGKETTWCAGSLHLCAEHFPWVAEAMGDSAEAITEAWREHVA